MPQEYHSFGQVAYREDGWASLKCSYDLARYYRTQIKEKAPLVQIPMHGSHITICSGKFDKPLEKYWGKYEGKWIKFTYTNNFIEDNRFWYLKVVCPFIISMRDELELEPLKGHRFLKRGLHLTLGRKLGR